MAGFIFFHLLLVLVFLSISATGEPNPSFVQTVCRPLKDRVFCVNALQPVPRSAKTDVQGLTMIATELAVVNATETLFYLTWLLKNVTGDDGLREAIRSCGKDYSAAAEGLGETLMDVAGRSYEQAYFRTQPREAAGKCRKVFGDSGLEYPPALAGRGEMLERLCDLVHDLIYWYLVDL